MVAQAGSPLQEAMTTIRSYAKGTTQSLYMTVVSIIQGLALACLIPEVFKQEYTQMWREEGIGSVLIFALQSLVVFQVIVVTWHVNVQHSTMLARTPDWADSYIPFLFAIPEYGLVTCLGYKSTASWFVCLSMYAWMCLWGIWDMYRASDKEGENRDVLCRLGSYRKQIQWYTFANAVCYGLIAWWDSVFESVSRDVGVLVLTNVSFGAFQFLHHYRCWKPLIEMEKRAFE